jgi:hypothetical protein
MIFCVVDEPLHGRGRNHFLEKTMHTVMDPLCFQGSTAQVLQAWPQAIRLGILKRVQTRTMTIYTEAKINRNMYRNGRRMHFPRAEDT